uniref:Uncharacterized protein n=1 Tax=Anguilla anguilla TaxID=7936 RepID=A0A0E9WIY6_ANGAN
MSSWWSQSDRLTYLRQAQAADSYDFEYVPQMLHTLLLIITLSSCI